MSRTVGWFTTIFPVALDRAAADDAVGACSPMQATSCARCRDRGLSYGLLRYAAPDTAVRACTRQRAAAAVLFNYLGQFDQVVAGSELFAFADESTGPWHGPSAQRTHALEVVAIVRDGRLEVDWNYGAGARPRRTIERAAEAFSSACASCIASAPSPERRASRRRISRWRGLDRDARATDSHAIPTSRTSIRSRRCSGCSSRWRRGRAHRLRAMAVPPRRVDRRASAAPSSRACGRAPQHPAHRIRRRRRCRAAAGRAAVVPLPWAEEDWRGFPDDAQAARLQALLRIDPRSGFDLAAAPLMRVALLPRWPSDAYQLVWSTHHLCVDGWSWPLVFRDVSRAYEAYAAGGEPQLEAAFRTATTSTGSRTPRRFARCSGRAHSRGSQPDAAAARARRCRAA